MCSSRLAQISMSLAQLNPSLLVHSIIFQTDGMFVSFLELFRSSSNFDDQNKKNNNNEQTKVVRGSTKKLNRVNLGGG